jgi:hypothetical protein
MVQVFDYNLIAYITLRTFPKMNLNKKFIQGLVIGSSKDSKKNKWKANKWKTKHTTLSEQF